eukprot:gnl/TRDRNA2_/TRDRNA2_191944_c0_seq1.p1 gnl/TRDRNA2_/TRDRNA2_191944_c0~~gnl/TRDRNA2_/TRDRNA2_191944_c0_seq1.p1  ORF type:complete len:484 (-),score=97.63 gnl/TRDRNA2_/TRDRNA2_191944_c0_seq1:319-1566(-)
MVPAAAIGQIQKDGAGFAPFAAWLDYGPDAADMLAIPDPSTMIQVPFQPELAFVIGDCYIEDEKVKDSPRWVLKEQIAKASEKGYTFKTGIEAEFFLLSPSEAAISDPADRQEKPCYDAGALMRRYAVLRDIVDTVNACGFGVYQTDHEDANGQFEINWHYRDCLTTADQHVFFKWVVKTIAERHGFRATFMPRPFKDLTGNGCHCHCSLWEGEKNLFVGAGGAKGTVEGLGISPLALQFLGGIVRKAKSFVSLTNPSVNSYKRLNGQITLSGATWAPNRVTFSGNNRTNMVRVPEGDRFELRLADGAANPYLLQATVLAAGLWGLAQQELDTTMGFVPPTVNVYKLSADAPELSRCDYLPANLLDALRALEADRELVELLGTRFVEAYLKIKYAEWADYTRHLSAWELEKTLDC